MSERVRSSTRVAVPVEEAFRVFTEEIDLWWRRGPRFRFDEDRDGRLLFEGQARLVERFDDGDEFEVGRVLAWEPPARLVFEFRAAKFAADEVTEVEVSFAPEEDGTRVRVEHRGWDAVRPGHPVRHGLRGPAFQHLMGAWWADLLHSLHHRA